MTDTEIDNLRKTLELLPFASDKELIEFEIKQKEKHENSD